MPPITRTNPQLDGNSSLAAMIKVLRSDTRMWLGRRTEICKGLEKLPALLGLRPAEIPISPSKLTKLLRQTGVLDEPLRRQRWEGLRPTVRAALERYGLSAASGRYNAALTKEWSTLQSKILDEPHRLTLSRFLHYLSARMVRPREVRDIHAEGFYKVISSEGLVRNPELMYRETCKAWNLGVQTILGWPRTLLATPSFSGDYALKATSFPKAFIRDLEAYLEFRSTDQFRAGLTRLRPATLRANRFTAIAFASCLVHMGRPANEITSLADLAYPKAVLKAAEFLTKRSRGRKTKQLTHITSLAAAIGRQWAHVPPKEQNQLEKLRVAYRWEYSGISGSNRVLLSQFDASGAVERLLSVPSKLQAMARAMPRDAEAARLMRCAVAIEILINAPMRTSELLGLKFTNCLLKGKPRSARLQLTQYRFFSARLRTSAISERCRSLINEYTRHYRSLISPSKCDLLFLARNGAALGGNAMTAAIKKWCMKLGGVEATPTLFRHFAAKHFLERHPDDLGALQGVMGHQSAVSTGATYRSLRASQASKSFDAAIFKPSRAIT